MNTFKKHLIFMLSFALQAQMHAGDFFHNGQSPREGYHYTPDDLDVATVDQIPAGFILTSSDPSANPSVARLALIVQDTTTGQWIVQYFIIESPSKKAFNSLEEAQMFTLLHLQSGVSQPQQQQQFIPSAGIPQKAFVPDPSTRGAWRRAHLRR